MGSDEAFGATLRRLRQQQGTSQADFAGQVGISRPTLWSWETGRTSPGNSKIKALSRALNLAESDLISASQIAAKPNFKQILEEEVASSKERIAASAGTTPDMIEIIIKL